MQLSTVDVTQCNYIPLWIYAKSIQDYFNRRRTTRQCV